MTRSLREVVAAIRALRKLRNPGPSYRIDWERDWDTCAECGNYRYRHSREWGRSAFALCSKFRPEWARLLLERP